MDGLGRIIGLVCDSIGSNMMWNRGKYHKVFEYSFDPSSCKKCRSRWPTKAFTLPAVLTLALALCVSCDTDKTPATKSTTTQVAEVARTNTAAGVSEDEKKSLSDAIERWLAGQERGAWETYASGTLPRSKLDIVVSVSQAAVSTIRAPSVSAKKDVDVLVLPVQITNRSSVPIKMTIAHEWYGGEWPPTDLYVSMLRPGGKSLPTFTPVFLAGEKNEATKPTVIEPGKSVSLSPRLDWPGTGSVKGGKILTGGGTYRMKVVLVFEAEGKKQFIESAPIMFGYQPTQTPATKPSRRDLSMLRSIALTDKDDLPAGLYCRVPFYADGNEETPPVWLYRYTISEIKRLGALPDLQGSDLSARLAGTYTARGTLEVAEQYIQGNTITIRIRYIAEDRDIMSRYVGVLGKKQFKSAYLWGYTPSDLSPGKYRMNVELDEFVRSEGGKLVPAPKDKICHRERLSSTFIVPPVATGAAGSRSGVAQVVPPHIARLIGRIDWVAHTLEADLARHTLVKIGQPAIKPLVWTMMNQGRQKNHPRAAEAAIILVKMAKAGQPQAFEALITGLKASGSIGGYYCPRALGEIGDRRAVKPLLDSLDLWSNATVIIALGKLGDLRAVKPLIAKLADPSAGVRAAAARSLARLGDQRAVGPLIRMLGDKDAGVRCWIIDSLGVLRNRKATAPLLALVKDKGYGVPRRAILALGKIGDSAALDTLIALLEDDKLAPSAAGALGQIGDRRAVEPLIKTVKKAVKQMPQRPSMRVPGIIWAGGAALGQLGDKRAVPLLLDLIQRPQAESEMYFAAIALGKIADPDSVPKLTRLFRDNKQQGWTRWQAAYALGQFRSQKAFDSLVAALEDAQPNVRASAAHALAQMGDRRAIKPVRKLLADKVDFVRKAAIEAEKKLKAK